MSFKVNVAFNYISQFYNGVIGILIMPFYLKALGVEAYGLIAFFTLLQSWFYLLDVGFSQTLTRETVRYRSGDVSAQLYAKLYKYINLIFAGVSVISVLVLFFCTNLVLQHWIKLSSLNAGDVRLCLQVMFISVGLRCLGGVYRGIIQGLERIKWLSGFNIIINTLRFIGVIPALYLFGFNIQTFFIYQLIVAVIEFVTLFICHKHALAQVIDDEADIINKQNQQYFSQVIKFALFSAANFTLWVFVSQSDKMLLSGILTLKDYAYYSMAILLSGIIYMISTPISNVLQPRLTALFAQNNHQALDVLYKKAAQFVTVLVAAVSASVFWNAAEVVYVWSGDWQVSGQVAHILQLYIVGNAFLAINAFTYYIQYAHGDVKRHFYGNLLQCGLMLPLMVFAAHHYGALGAGYVWLAVHVFWFFSWTIFINKTFTHNYWQWTTQVSQIFVGTFIFSYFLKLLFDLIPVGTQGRMAESAILVLYGALVLMVSLSLFNEFRVWVRKFVQKH